MFSHLQLEGQGEKTREEDVSGANMFQFTGTPHLKDLM